MGGNLSFQPYPSRVLVQKHFNLVLAATFKFILFDHGPPVILLPFFMLDLLG